MNGSAKDEGVFFPKFDKEESFSTTDCCWTSGGGPPSTSWNPIACEDLSGCLEIWENILIYGEVI